MRTHNDIVFGQVYIKLHQIASLTLSMFKSCQSVFCALVSPAAMRAKYLPLAFIVIVKQGLIHLVLTFDAS